VTRVEAAITPPSIGKHLPTRWDVSEYARQVQLLQKINPILDPWHYGLRSSFFLEAAATLSIARCDISTPQWRI
jgi:hypothetical protein